MRKVLVIGTGGTISCVKTENGLAPSIPLSELLKDIDLPVEIHSEQLLELDSTNMTPRHWEQLARHIHKNYDDFDGFVITHGTDTMAYGAAALSVLIQSSRKPVVLTGSMKPMTEENSDAPKNLRDAVSFAADERAFGVNVVFNGVIIDGRCAHKRDSEDTDAFESHGREVRGYFSDTGEIIFSLNRSGQTQFYKHLSDRVFLAKLIPGQRLCVPENARAVILECYGAGGVPSYLYDDIAVLANRGVYVIVGTQCEHGGTRLSEYEVGQRAMKAFKLLETGLMSTEYAVARAQWAVTYSYNYEDFKKLFYLEYIEVN